MRAPGRGARARMFRMVSDAVDDGLPIPTNVTLHHHYASLELNMHGQDATVANVKAWARRLALGEPQYGRVQDDQGCSGGRYRALKATGSIVGFEVVVTAYIDIVDDSSGLECTGWLVPVWVAAARHHVQPHLLVEDGDQTACGRSTRTGERTTAAQAQQWWEPSWSCKRCWPDGSPITTDGAA